MDALTVSTVLEEALVEVLANLHVASAKVAQLQSNPDIEPKTLALHTRPLNAQVAALKALTTTLDKLTRLQTPPQPAPEQVESDDPPESLEALVSELAALHKEIPDFEKNISPPVSPPQPPIPVSSSSTQNSELKTQNSPTPSVSSVSSVVNSPSPTQNSFSPASRGRSGPTAFPA